METKLNCIELRTDGKFNTWPLSYLPSTEEFKSGLYMIETGGNDFSYAYMTLKMITTQVTTTILPKVVGSIVRVVQDLYNEGARNFLVRDVMPPGCGPFWLTYFSHTSNDLD